MVISIIVAYDNKRAIAKNDKIPWHYSEDLKHFKKTTQNSSVIMGRKTWDSLDNKPLPNRYNVILSRKGGIKQESVAYAKDILEAISLAYHKQKVFVIGGAEIYSQFLDLECIDRIIATEIKDNFEGDTFFPEINDSMWAKNITAKCEDFNIVQYDRL